MPQQANYILFFVIQKEAKDFSGLTLKMLHSDYFLSGSNFFPPLSVNLLKNST
jgi:hypothetical protein